MSNAEDSVKKKESILVIDDEPEIRSLLSRFLAKKGFNVRSAGTVSEGKRMVNNNAPRLIFLDVNLPDGNGLQALKDFKYKYSEMVVIMMSAFDHPELKMEALRFGALDFLSKPFNIDRLNQVVQNQFLNSTNQTKNHGKNSRN